MSQEYDDITDILQQSNSSLAYNAIFGLAVNDSARAGSGGFVVNRMLFSELMLCAILLILVCGLVAKVYKCVKFRRRSPIYCEGFYRSGGDAASVEMYGFGDNFVGRVGGGSGAAAGDAAGDGSNETEN